MNISLNSRIRLIIPALFLLLCSFSVSTALAAGSRDILWDIVSTCLDSSATDYCSSCRWPRADSPCTQSTDCKKSTQVWAESEAFVVLRDPKMCGCPDDFIHGLALPRARVSGVEDTQRPAAIWKYAWDAGLARIKDSSTLALAVNPPGNRNQDQLHVHLVRLADDALQRIVGCTTASVSDLDQVWSVAAQRAADQGLENYGVLVFQRPEGGFSVLVDRENTEKKYTKFRCR